MFVGTQALRNFNANLNLTMSSASPYTIRTGIDANGDLIFNDRPIGVGRNSARGEGRFELSGFFAYTFMFGKRRIRLPPGIMINGLPGNMTVTPMQNDPMPRFGMALQVNAQNLTNHRNYTGYGGNLTSQFFGRPTSVSGMRKIDVGLNFTF